MTSTRIPADIVLFKNMILALSVCWESVSKNWNSASAALQTEIMGVSENISYWSNKFAILEGYCTMGWMSNGLDLYLIWPTPPLHSTRPIIESLIPKYWWFQLSLSDFKNYNEIMKFRILHRRQYNSIKRSKWRSFDCNF